MPTYSHSAGKENACAMAAYTGAEAKLSINLAAGKGQNWLQDECCTHTFFLKIHTVSWFKPSASFSVKPGAERDISSAKTSSSGLGNGGGHLANRT